MEIPFLEEFRIGNVYTMMVFGLNIDTTEYGYRFDGVYDPGKGMLFDSARVVLDPYAKSVSGRTVWGKTPDKDKPFQHRGRIIREDYVIICNGNVFTALFLPINPASTSIII